VSRTIARWAGGFVLGLVGWLAIGPAWHPMVMFVTARAFNLVEHPNVTSLEPEGDLVIVHRTDFDPRSPRPKLSVSDLTFNIVLLVALAVGAGVDDRHRAARIFSAIALMLALHAAALYAQIMSIYALQLGAWSTANYGPVARNIWATTTHFYRFVGCHAAAFLMWWYVLGGANVRRKAD
jgi:hypothetical protein